MKRGEEVRERGRVGVDATALSKCCSWRRPSLCAALSKSKFNYVDIC